MEPIAYRRLDMYTETVKNITVTVTDELYRAARLRAAEQGATVSALVRGFLEQVTGSESAFERLARQQEAMLARIHGEHVGPGQGDRR